jgi:hypothetical protein
MSVYDYSDRRPSTDCCNSSMIRKCEKDGTIIYYCPKCGNRTVVTNTI